MSAPLISVCIPTHTGRAAVLDRLLSRMAEELGSNADVEVCVSDNASRDDTQRVLARHRDALGERLVTSRNERDLGLAPNMLRATELARGRFVWLLGSDDLPVPGAVAEVLALLAAHPDVTGVCVGLRRVDHRDLVTPAPAIFAEGVPAERSPTVYKTLPEVLAAVGLLPWAMSANVVRRSAWMAAAAMEREALRAFPTFPQLLIIGRAMCDAPHWAWHPRQLVLSSSGTYYLDDADQLRGDPVGQIATMTNELDGVFAHLHGRYSPAHKALLHRWQQIAFGPTALQGARVSGTMRLRDDLRQLGLGLRRFWWLRTFRRSALLPLLVPSAVASRWRAREVVPATTVTCRELPGVWTAGYQQIVSCTVANRGARALPWLGAQPVRLGSRWYDAHGGRLLSEGPRAALLPALRAGRARVVALRVDVPREPGRYLLRIAPLQEGRHWFDDIDPTSGWAAVVEVAEAPSLAGSEG